MTALSAQPTWLTVAGVVVIAFTIFVNEKCICLIIVLKILSQSTMWATTTDRIRIILTLTLTTLNGDNTQTSHRVIKINMLLHWVDKTSLLNHLNFTNKIKGKEAPAIINSVLLKLWLRSTLWRIKQLSKVQLYP